MAAQLFEATARQAGALAVIDLRGEIDGNADEALNLAYAQAAAFDAKSILLNFTHVDYINSTGIALIVGVLARARQAGQRVFTCGLSPHYTEIFQITRLADFMTIVPDEASALASQ